MLESKRLFFCNYRKEDIEFLEKLLSNPNMMKYIGNGTIRNSEQALNFFNWINEHYNLNANYGLKILINKVTGEKIGHAGLVPQIVEGKEYIEVGYWIEEEYWGKGYGFEAANTLINFGVAELKLPKIIALIQDGNIASEKIALNNGMKLERSIILDGKVVKVYTLNDGCISQ